MRLLPAAGDPAVLRVFRAADDRPAIGIRRSCRAGSTAPSDCRSRSATTAITAYLLGGAAGVAGRRLPRGTHGAARPRRRDGSAQRRGAARFRRAVRRRCRASASAVLAAVGFAARRDRAVARPDRARRDAARARRGASTASSIRASTSAARSAPVVFGVMLDHGSRARSFCVDRRVSSSSRSPPSCRSRAGSAATPRPATDRSADRWISASPADARSCAPPARGSDAAAPRRWRAKACDVTIVARTEADVARGRRRDRRRGRPRRRAGSRATSRRRKAARKALAACPQPDILVNNAGGPPPGDFRDWDRDAWIRALDANMLTPIELIKATVDGMIARKFGRIVNITSSRGEGADRHPRPVERRAQRPDRLRRGARAQGRARTT